MNKTKEIEALKEHIKQGEELEKLGYPTGYMNAINRKILGDLKRRCGMRKIKFRGKRIDNSEWIYGNLMKSLIDKKYIIELVDDVGAWQPNFRLLYAEVDPSTVGQYTGLKDKNGTEIYEGDILKCVDLNGEEYTTAVSFDGGAFAVDSIGCDYDYTAIGWAMEFDIDECWVIGNIHDNPELLGGAE